MATFSAGVYAECVSASLIVESKYFSTRVVTITHGLNQDFLGTFDLKVFKENIGKVFKWHEGDHTNFLSPSFAIVQSSGMDKAKLMREYSLVVEKRDIECMMILCMEVNMQEVPPVMVSPIPPCIASFADSCSLQTKMNHGSPNPTP